MDAGRIAGSAGFVGLLLLAPAWVVLSLLAGNGLSEREGWWLLGGVALCLLLALVVVPLAMARLARHWQARIAPAVAAVAAFLLVGALAFAVLLLATGTLLGVLAS